MQCFNLPFGWIARAPLLPACEYPANTPFGKEFGGERDICEERFERQVDHRFTLPVLFFPSGCPNAPADDIGDCRMLENFRGCVAHFQKHLVECPVIGVLRDQAA